VVLFDEIEKAHADVFNVLLQLLDDGRLTDGHGRTVDFRNTVVIMTSNIASQLILGYRGEDYEKMKDECLEVLRRSFRPEFLNRVDEIVVFHPLAREQLRQIVEIQLARLRKRLEERKIELELTDKARDYLAEHGYDPSFGARPLKRLIQRELETALGRKLLVGEVRDNSRVKVDANARGLDFKSEAAAPAAA
jgi:ATP-dependent Clp protease ATP-binding subunit ClpB